MRNFILGIVVTIVVLLIIAFGAASLGLLPTTANSTPPQWERHFAMSALDNSVERHAAHTNNPVPPTDDNLIEGLKIYTMHCAECHGGIDRKTSPMRQALYPPPPNLISHPVDDDPEWQTFYVTRNGIRYSAMPAWDKILTEPELWKVTSFLSHVEKLPPAVQDFWKKSGGAPAESEHSEAQH